MRSRRCAILLAVLGSGLAANAQTAPTLGAAYVVSPDDRGECLGAEVSLGLNGAANVGPGGESVTWYRGDTPDFDVAGAEVVATVELPPPEPAPDCTADAPVVVAALVDPCPGADVGNAREQDEMLVVWSGGGFAADDLGVDYLASIDDDDFADLGSGGTCPLVEPVPGEGPLVSGTCVRYAGPGDEIPRQAFALVFPSRLASASFDAQPLNDLGYAVYVLRSSCSRRSGANGVAGVLRRDLSAEGGSRDVPVDLGCGPTAFTYASMTEGGTSSEAGWAIADGSQVGTACGDLPAARIAAVTPFGASETAVAFATFTTTVEQCGTRYYRAAVSRTTGGCEAPVSDAVAVAVACPTVVLGGDTTICVGDPFPALGGIASSGVSEGADVSFDLTGPAGTSTSDVATVTGGRFTFGAPSAIGEGVYEYVVTDVRTESDCDALVEGTVRVVVLASGDASCLDPDVPALRPLDTTICDEGKSIRLDALEDPEFPGGTWDGSPFLNGSRTRFRADVAGVGSYTLTYLPPVGVDRRPGVATIVVTDEIAYGELIGPSVAVCPGDGIDLRRYLPPDAPAGAWTATPSSLLDADGFTFTARPSDASSRIEVRFEPVAPCADPKAIELDIAPPATVSIVSDAPPACQGVPYDLGALLAPGSDLSGVWSGDFVTGSTFEPPAEYAGLVDLSYAPGGAGCFAAVSATLLVEAPTAIAVADRFVCEGDELRLRSLLPVGAPPGSWNVVGATTVIDADGETVLTAFTPPGTEATATFTPDPGTCFAPGTGTLTLRTGDAAASLRTSDTTLCSDAGAFDLDATVEAEALGGTWTDSDGAPRNPLFDPATEGAGGLPVALLYLPADDCGDVDTLTVSVQPARPLEVNGGEDSVGVCAADLPLALASLLGAEDPSLGRWTLLGEPDVPVESFAEAPRDEPYLLTYGPSPDTASCLRPDTIAVRVVDGATPLVVAIDTCAGVTLDLNAFGLPADVTLDFPAVAPGGVVDVVEAATPIAITATVASAGPGFCYGEVSFEITPRAAGARDWDIPDTTICADELPLALATLEPAGAAGGTWTPLGGGPPVAEVTDLGDARSYVYEGPAGEADACGHPRDTVVLAPGPPSRGDTVATACAGAVVDLASFVPAGYPPPVFSGSPAISGATLPTDGLSGEIVIDVAFGPGASPCVTPFRITLTVEEGDALVTPTAEYCPGAPPLELSTLLLPGAPTGGTWRDAGGTIVTTFAETTPDGYALTYTPPVEGGACEAGATALVTVLEPATISEIEVPVCVDGEVDLRALAPDGAGELTVADARVEGGVFDASGLAPGARVTVLAQAGADAEACLGDIPFVVVVVGGGEGTALSSEAFCGAVDLDDYYRLDPADGSWSGIAGGGSRLDTVPGTYELTYTPADDCLPPQVIIATVQAPPEPLRLAACAGDTLDLLAAAPPGSAPAFDAALVPDPARFPTDTLDGVVRLRAAIDGEAAGLCGDSVTYEITVRPLVTTAPLSAVVCSLSLPLDLRALEDPAFPGGTWTHNGAGSLAGGVTFTASASGDYELTYVPPADADPCILPGTAVVTVAAEVSPPELRASTCAGGTVDLAALAEAFPAPLGALTFAGPGVVGDVFTAPSGAADSVVLRAAVAPSAGACYGEVVAVILIGESVATFVERIAPVCPGDDPFDLDAALVEPAPNGTWEQSAYVSGSTFDPAAAPPDSVRVWYRTDPALCARDTFVTVYLGTGTGVDIAERSVCAHVEEIDLSVFYAAEDLPPGRWLLGTQELRGDSLEVAGREGETLALTFEPEGDCAEASEVRLRVSGPASVALRPGVACAGAGPIDLDELLTGTPASGSWAAEAGVVTGSSFDASGLAPGEYEVTFTPADACALPATTEVRVGTRVAPVLRSDTVCAGATLDLAALVDPDFPEGSWSGPGVAGGTTFDASDPAVLPDAANAVTFRASGTCGGEAQAAIRVVGASSSRPELKPLEICRDNAEVIDLATLEDDDFPTGRWEGPGVSDGEFVVAAVVGMDGPITLTFTPDRKCALPGRTEIAFSEQIVPELGTTTLCATTSDFPLVNLADPRLPEGSWNGLGVVDNRLFDATTVVDPGTEATFEISFTPDEACGAIGYTEVLIRNEVAIPSRDSAFCGAGEPFDLGTLLDLPLAGTWSPESRFDPADIPAGSGTEATFTPAEVGCYQPTSILLERLGEPPLGLATVTTCSQADPFDLLALLPDPTAGGFVVGGRERVSLVRDLARDTVYDVTYVPSDACSFPETFEVRVTRAVEIPLLDDRVCGGPSYDLDDLFVGEPVPGAWSGPGVSGSSADLAGLAPGEYVYTFTPAGGAGCARPSRATLALGAAQALSLGPRAVCAGDDPIDLDVYLPEPLAGEWRGLGVGADGRTFDPAALPGGGEIALRYVPEAITCTSEAELALTVLVGGVLPPVDTTLCLPPSTTTVALDGFAPASADEGSWRLGGAVLAEAAVSAAAIGPDGVELAYEGSGACPVRFNLTLRTADSAVVLDTLSVCTAEGGIGLPLLDATLPAGAPTGMWSVGGATVTDSLDVATLGNISEVRWTAAAGACDGAYRLPVRVVGAVDYDFATDTVCAGGGPADLNDLLVPPPPVPGRWIGPDVTAEGILAASTTSGTIAVAFAPAPGSCAAEVAYATTVNRVQRPAARVDSFVVDAAGATYTAYASLSVGSTDPPISTDLGSFPSPRLLVVAGLACGSSAVANVAVGGRCGETLPVDVAYACEGSASYEETVDTLLCAGEPFSFRGEAFGPERPTGVVTRPGPLGDSVFTVRVTYRPPAVLTLAETVCEGESFTVGTERFDALRPTGEVVLLGAAAGGCDSTVVVDLAFEPGSTVAVEGPPELCLDGAPVALRVSVTAKGEGVVGTAVVNGVTVEDYALPEGESTIELPTDGDAVGFRLFAIRAAGADVCTRVSSPEPAYRPRTSRMSAVFTGPGGSPAFASCGAEGISAIGVSIVGGAGSYAYDWSDGSTTATITDVVAGTYDLIVVDAIGCRLEERLEVAEGVAADFDVDPADPACPAGAGSIGVQVGGDVEGLAYVFDGSASLPVPADGALRFDSLPAGQYAFSLLREGGCRADTSVALVDPVFDDLIAPDELTVDLGLPVTVEADLPADAVGVRWTPEPEPSDVSGGTATFRPAADATVLLSVTAAGGCVLEDQVRLIVREVVAHFLPTAFSPNDDGRNERYGPAASAGAVERIRRMSIFDRWGERVYQRLDFVPGDESAGWDGRVEGSGEEAASGVYIVVAEVELAGGIERTYTSDLTLVR